MTVAEIPADATFVSNSEEVQHIREHLSLAPDEDFDSFFVRIGNGEYTDVWGMTGTVPFNDKNVYPVSLVRQLSTQTGTIDITPESVKTPEGAARVTKALKAWDETHAEVANLAAQFVDAHGAEVLHCMEMYEGACEDFRELRTAIEARARKQDEFLRVLAAR